MHKERSAIKIAILGNFPEVLIIGLGKMKEQETTKKHNFSINDVK